MSAPSASPRLVSVMSGPHVPRRFAEQLEGLLRYLRTTGVDVGEAELEALEADLSAQIADGLRRTELERELAELRARFGIAQAERHARYERALRATRAANQGRPEVLRALADLTRRERGDVVTVFTAYRRAR